MRAAPPLATFAVMLWGISGSSYWRDEASTMDAVHRPFWAMLRMLGNVDAVHGAYYVILWPLVHLFGSSELVARLPSAVAMAAAAAATAALGRRLVSVRAGLAAGLVFAVLPQVSWYGQEARSYAMATALAALASYLLVRAMGADRTAGGPGDGAAGPGNAAAGDLGDAAGGPGDAAGGPGGAAAGGLGDAAGGPGGAAAGGLGDATADVGGAADGAAAGFTGERRWLLAYGVCLVALGMANIDALLLIPAHAVTVRLWWSRNFGSAAARSLGRGWLAAVGSAVVVVSPLAGLSWTQRGQVAWLPLSGLAGVRSLQQLLGPAGIATALIVAVACGLAVGARAQTSPGGRGRLRQDWPAQLLRVAVPWLVVPPVLLLAVGSITPEYTFRYILFCIPAVALLAGAGLAELGWAAGTVALAVVVAFGAPTLAGLRDPAGHGENIRAADRVVAAAMRPGDAVIYAEQANLASAYPYGLARLHDIARVQSGVQAGNLTGTSMPAPVVRARLADVPRLWVVGLRSRSRIPLLQGLPLKKVRAWQIADIWLVLYVPQRVR